MDRYTSLFSRVLFVAALLGAALAVWERLANAIGYTTVIRDLYEPGRILEFCAIALLFVIAMVLREIKYSLAPRAKV